MQENGEHAVRFGKIFNLMIYSYYDLLNHLCRCCVANLTHMLQTSFNQTHVLVASNSISFSCLEGRMYIIILLNKLPVLTQAAQALVVRSYFFFYLYANVP